MSTFISTFGVILAALLVVAGAIGTWAAFRVGRNAQTVSNYRDALGSWKERSEAQDVKIEEQHSEMTQLRENQHKLEAENADLRGQILVLRDAISGRQVFDTIVDAIEDQNRKLLEMSNKQHTELMERLDRLAGGR